MDLGKLTVVKLKAKCKELGLTGYSKLRKAELIQLLVSSQELTTVPVSIRNMSPLPVLRAAPKAIPRRPVQENHQDMTVLSKQEKDSDSCTHIESILDKWYDISYIVCGILRYGMNWKQLLQQTPSCSNVGDNFSTSLVRIAATRIFAVPEQSILELPVNSLDSYTQLEKGFTVGKFGLGFFSFLYWLIDHPSRYITMDTTYENSSGIMCSWSIRIQERDSKLQFRILETMILETAHNPQTGTKVTLFSENDPFRSDQMDRFRKQLYKLENVEGVKFNLKTVNGYQNLNISQSEKSVSIDLYRDKIQIQDWAAGIPLDVLFSSLLVPSISTKTIAISEQGNNYNFGYLTSMIPSVRGNEFKIIIGGVGIVSIPFETESSISYQVTIDMPLGTRLPVSRDDILFDLDSTQKYFLDNLRILREKYAFEMYQDVHVLTQSLKAYTNYSSSTLLSELVDLFIRETIEEIQNYGFIPIPIQYRDVFSNISNQWNKTTFISVTKIDLNTDAKIIQRFENHLNSTTYLGRYVGVVKLPSHLYPATDAGTSTLLLIDSSFVDSHPNWQLELPLIYGRSQLTLPSISESDFQNLSTQVSSSNPFIQDMTINMLHHLKDFISDFKPPGSVSIRTEFPPEAVNQILLQSVDSINIALSRGGEGLATEYLVELDEMLTRGGVRSKGVKQFLSSPVWIEVVDSELLVKLTGENVVEFLTNESGETVEKAQDYSRKWNNFILRSISGWEKILSTQVRLYFYSSILDPFRIYFSEIRQIALMVLEKSNNIFEYASLLFTLLLNNSLLTMLWNLTLDVQSQLIDRLLIDGRIISVEEIQHLFAQFYVTLDYTFMLERFSKVYERSAKVYLSVRDIDSYTQESVSNLLSPFVFTGTQLLDYVYHNNVNPDSFLSTIPQVASWKKEESSVKLQALEIAINEGTSKSPIRAMLTETIQNSVDAIRTSNISNRSIAIDISVDSETEFGIILSITDRAGIPPKGIMAMMIPFLSTKTPDDIVVGEMGSGFFNVYRGARKVGISSNNVEIRDYPLFDETGRIVDLERHVLTDKNLGNRGTVISIALEISSAKERENVMFEINNYVMDVISLIGDPTIPIVFNGENVNLHSNPLLKTRHFELEMLGDSTTESYILTKGIPFAPLYSYFSDKDVINSTLLREIRNGVVLNIKSGVYTPVQSRTSLNIDPDSLAELKDFLYDSIYMVMKTQLEHDPSKGSLYLPVAQAGKGSGSIHFHIPSHFSPDKVSTPREFFLNYHYSNEMSLAEGVNFVVEKTNGFGERELSKISNEVSSNSTIPYEGLNILSNYWNIKKIQRNERRRLPNLGAPPKTRLHSMGRNKMSQDDKKRNQERSDFIHIFRKILKLFIDLYWEIGTNGERDGYLIGTSFQNHTHSPAVGTMTRPFLGGLAVYNPGYHAISMGTHIQASNYLPPLVSLLTNLNIENMATLRDNPLYETLFGVRDGRQSIILHELEHAWRPVGVGHDDVRLQIAKIPEKIYTFDEGAVAVGKWIYEQKFFERFIQILNQEVPDIMKNPNKPWPRKVMTYYDILNLERERNGLPPLEENEEEEE